MVRTFMGFLLLPARRYPILGWKKAPRTQRNRVLRQREQAAEPESRPYGKVTADREGLAGLGFANDAIDRVFMAAQLGIAERTLRTWASKRKVPTLRLGHRTVLFDPPKVWAAVNKFEVKTAAK
jgi:hypothetical protein